MFRNSFSDIYAPPRTRQLEDDEFDGPALDAKWTPGGFPAIVSYDNRIRSALQMQFVTGENFSMTQSYANAGNFSVTMCFDMQQSDNFHNITLYVLDVGGGTQQGVGIQWLYNSATTIRTVKYVTGSFSQVDTTTIDIFDFPVALFHIQRSTNNWELYYSNNGVIWTKMSTTIALTFTVARLMIQGGMSGASANCRAAIHWFRRDWITL